MIQNNNLQSTNNIFSLFPPYSLEQANEIQNQNNTTAKPQAAITEKKDSVELTKKKSSKAKKIIFGSTLASTIITAGIVSMFFAKGVHGSSLKKLVRFKEKLAKEISESSRAEGLTQKTVLYTKKGAQKAIDGLEATSNFAAIKDWTCDRILRLNKATAKFAEKSRNLFKKVVDKTLGKKYDKVEVKVRDLASLLKHYNITNLENLDEAQKIMPVTIKGETKTLAEWLAKLHIEINRLESAYDNGFSLGARKLREQKRSKLLSGISDKIKEKLFGSKGFHFNPKNYKTYVTQDVSSTAQKELKEEIISARKEVTNSITSIYDDIRSKINDFSNTVNVQDSTSIEFIKKLNQQLEAFKKCSGANEALSRKKIVEEISSNIDDFINLINKSNYSEADKKNLFSILKSIKSVAKSSSGKSKGALEEIMTIIKGLNGQTIQGTNSKLISDSEYRDFSRLAAKISKGLDNATELEMGEYFLKQAELEVGSAATDVLSLLFPIGAGAIAIAKGDDKEEKVSATLTTCIPLAGSFVTFIYGTTKMFSGAKNLMFSLISGIALGKLGNYCDKLYKKYKESGSVTKVAKEEYDNFWTDLTPKYAQPLKNDDTKNQKNKKSK